MTTESHRDELERLLRGLRVSEGHSDTRRGNHWTVVATAWNQPASGTFDVLLTIHPTGRDVAFPEGLTVEAHPVSELPSVPTLPAGTQGARPRPSSREISPPRMSEAESPSPNLAGGRRRPEPTAFGWDRRASGSLGVPGSTEVSTSAELAGPKTWLRGVPAGTFHALTLRNTEAVITVADAAEAVAQDVGIFAFSFSEHPENERETPGADLELPDGRRLFLTSHPADGDTLLLSLRTGSRSLPEGSEVTVALVHPDATEDLIMTAHLRPLPDDPTILAADGAPIARARLLADDGSLRGRLELRCRRP